MLATILLRIKIKINNTIILSAVLYGSRDEGVSEPDAKEYIWT
jgi:hypothetical protein